jgi:hypothetical protein
LVTARIDVSDSGPSACKLIREGRFHCNICKRRWRTLALYIVTWSIESRMEFFLSPWRKWWGGCL